MDIKFSVKSQQKSIEIIDNCIECGKCVMNCEMLKTYTTSPKVLFNQSMDNEIPFSCQLCDHCLSVCPKEIDLKSAFFSMRQDAQNQMKIKTTAVDFHQKTSFSSFISSKVKPNKKVFFPGCSLAAHDPEMVMRLYNYIKDDDMSIWTSCCGNPTYTLGKKNEYTRQLSQLKQVFHYKGITEVIVACQNCYKMFKEHTNLKVTSVFEILNDLPLAVKSIEIDKSLVLHDPCPTRKYDIIHDSVRQLLDKLSIEYTEYEYNRTFTQCCGSGAMVGVTNISITKKQAKQRALQSKSDAIITYCQECVETLGKEKETLHLLDLLFNNGIKKNSTHTFKKWTNRRLIKLKIDRIK
ncbi:MAG: (Fe-S)-binding protein [Clostridiales bacterium]|nr:(Fe-S)-binding protein [Clostridiales bacterium]